MKNIFKNISRAIPAVLLCFTAQTFAASHTEISFIDDFVVDVENSTLAFSLLQPALSTDPSDGPSVTYCTNGLIESQTYDADIHGLLMLVKTDLISVTVAFDDDGSGNCDLTSVTLTKLAG